MIMPLQNLKFFMTKRQIWELICQIKKKTDLTFIIRFNSVTLQK